MEKDEIREIIIGVPKMYRGNYSLEQIKYYFDKAAEFKIYKDITLSIEAHTGYEQEAELCLMFEGTRKKTQKEIEKEVKEQIERNKTNFLDDYRSNYEFPYPEGLSQGALAEIRKLERIEHYEKVKPSYNLLKINLKEDELEAFLKKYCLTTIEELEKLIYG